VLSRPGRAPRPRSGTKTQSHLPGTWGPRSGLGTAGPERRPIRVRGTRATPPRAAARVQPPGCERPFAVGHRVAQLGHSSDAPAGTGVAAGRSSSRRSSARRTRCRPDALRSGWFALAGGVVHFGIGGRTIRTIARRGWHDPATMTTATGRSRHGPRVCRLNRQSHWVVRAATTDTRPIVLPVHSKATASTVSPKGTPDAIENT
jgi:hypothetical protein